MYNKSELIEAINELQNANHTIQNCNKLASLYTVLDHTDKGYSNDEPIIEDKVDDYGNSDFLRLIAYKNAKDMWLLMDDLMYTLSVTNKRLYNSVIDKLW